MSEGVFIELFSTVETLLENDILLNASFFLVDNEIRGRQRGIEVIEKIRSANSGAQIVLWSRELDDQLNEAAIKAGANNAIPKEVSGIVRLKEELKILD